MQASSTELIGDRYLLQERTGGQGQVELFDALDRSLDRPVTIQMLTEVGAADESISRAFLRHQQIASSIHNCPLRAVYDAGIWRGRPYSVMERDKGSPPESLHRPGYPPAVPLVLQAVRQVAESLQCCREAGLTDWTFAPGAVSVDSKGTAWLGIVEGLGGEHSSSRPSTDGASLVALLNLMLAGQPDPSEGDYKVALVPGWVTALVSRLAGSGGAGALTAGDFARELAETEEAANQPTAAYAPPAGEPAAPAVAERSAAVASLVAASTGPDAPTLQAEQIPAKAQTAPLPMLTEPRKPDSEPYTPRAIAVQESDSRQRIAVLPIVVLLGLLLLALIGAFLLPRLRSAGVAARPAPTQPAPAQVAAPDLRGRTLIDGQNLLTASGLKLVTGAYINDDTVTKDAIARQAPAPGTQLQAGQPITVNLSLGPAATPVQPTAVPVQQAPVQAQPPAPPAPGQGDGNGNGNGKGKGHGKKGGH